MRAIVAAVLVLAMLVGLAILILHLVSEPDALPVPLGNSQANLANQGLVVSAGEWLYYANPAASYSVKRLRKSDWHVEDLSGVYGMYLNRDDKYLYYVDTLTERLSRVPLTGQGIERLQKDKVSFAMLADGRLYYTKLEHAGVYSCRPDGTEERMLSVVRTEQLLALDDELVFSDLSRAGSMGQMKRRDGSGLAYFEIRLGQTAVPFGNAVYFIDNRGDQRVYRADYAGSSEFLLYDANIGVVSGITAGENALFFVSLEDDGCLYRRQNHQDAKITDYAVFAPQIVDEWLYVCRADEDGALYRIDMHNGDTVKLP